MNVYSFSFNMKGKVHITCFEKCNLQPVQTKETSSVAWLLTCTNLDYSPLCQLEGTWKPKKSNL